MITRNSNACTTDRDDESRTTGTLVAHPPTGTAACYDEWYETKTRPVGGTVIRSTGAVMRPYDRIGPRKHAPDRHDVEGGVGGRATITDNYREGVSLVQRSPAVFWREWT